MGQTATKLVQTDVSMESVTKKTGHVRVGRGGKEINAQQVEGHDRKSLVRKIFNDDNQYI